MSVSRRLRKIWAALREPGALRVLYQGITLTPRLIANVGAVAALAGMLGACVPATQYEEVKSASEVEAAKRQHAESELAAMQAKLDAANAELSERDQKLAQTQEAVSQSQLEHSVALKERDEATGLVEQLRGELGRVGDDLRSYAQQKADLQKSLEEAKAAQAKQAALAAQAAQIAQKSAPESDAHAVSVARLVRDLTATLGERVLSGDISIDVTNGKVLLAAPSELWFGDDAKLIAGADNLAGAIAHVLVLHGDATVTVTPAGDAELAKKRGEVLVSAFVAKGVAAPRMTTATPDPDQPPSAQIELAFLVK